MTDMVERVARALAGHFGPEFDRLPKDKAELRSVRRQSMVYSDNTQDALLEAAKDAVAAMRPDTDDTIDQWIVCKWIDAALSQSGEG